MFNSNVFLNKPLQKDEIYPANDIVSLESLTGMRGRSGYDLAVVSGGRIVNIVSNRYGHLPNEVFFHEVFMKMDDTGMEYDYRAINRNDQSFALDIILTDPKVRIDVKGTDDEITPMLRFTNSYDGSGQTSGSFGFFRKVCQNGLHVSHTAIGFKTKHHANVQSIVLPEISGLMTKFMDNEFYTLRRVFEVMYDCVETKPLDYIKHVCDRTKVFAYHTTPKSATVSKLALSVLDIAEREAVELGTPVNRWLLYNGFNHVIHNDLVRPFREQATLDAKLFEIMAN